MKTGFESAITTAVQAMGNGSGPRPLHIAISLALGVLTALAAGSLHRSDRPNPLAPNFSVQAVIKRAGATLFGTAPLTLTLLRSQEQGITILILLLAAIGGVGWGLLTYFDDSTLQTAIWKGAKAAASAVAAGQAYWALYGKN